MATVNINEILGSDSISGSRVTLNSNFLILQNWINGYVNVFGIDTINGILDLSGATTGKVQAKIGKFDSISLPSTGTALASLSALGAASFTDVQTTTFTASGALNANSLVTLGTQSVFVAGGTASFNGQTTFNSANILGVSGHIVSLNTTYAAGTAGTPFPSSTSGIGGGGVVTSVDAPYAITGLEDVLYANCGPTGFFMKVCDGIAPVGGTLPAIPQGTRLTIVNTSGGVSKIYCGVTGNTSQYYTGFNTDLLYGGYSTSGITPTSNQPYQSAVTLQWEPRIAAGQATQNGSWVVLSAVNMTV
jgi:hypothetical protein